PSRAQKICNQFDLLISTVRPIRNAVTLILESKNNLIASTGFCKLSNIKVNPYYLFALFKTNIFIKLLDRKTTATQYPAVNENDILNLRIPLLSNSFQSQIETSVKQAYAKQEQSKKLYHEAEEILLKELNLLEFTPTQFLTFSTSVKNIQLVGRFDAEYFQPKYTQIENKIKNYKGGYDIIKNIFNLKKGVEVGADAYLENQEGKGFYRVADISPNSIRLTDKKISNELFYKLKNDFQPKIGDILFTKDGTIGISYLVNENIEGIVSSAFLRLTLKKQFEHFNKETLTLILNSPLCKLQCEKLSGGALIEHLKPCDFEKFFIPIIQKSVQNQIQQRVQESYILKN
ncbi:MAG: hypothetical protein ORN58_06355, partial [Sediminibacterium sp.]|nr:hypothetical protein [Sediminibacterium sp.]